MRGSHTAQALRFALATLLLGMGIGFLISGVLARMEEDRDDSARAGEYVEPAKHGEAERGRLVVHASVCSPLRGLCA
jgi:hypothetical protein